MNKSKRAKSKKERCPIEAVATNDPSWYLRDGTPRFSGEFDDLQKIGVVNRVLPNGISLDTAAQHLCVVAPPVDTEASMYKQAATLLSKVRKKNTGANIYTSIDVLVYLWKLDIALAAFAELSREIAAVSHVMPGNADSPWVALNVVNSNRDWEAEAAVLADTKNEADIVAKMIDALPIPDHTMIDRICNVFHNIFADSKGGKPSFSTFIPARIIDLSVSAGVVTTTVREPNGGTGISAGLQVVRDILDDIYTDNGANFTMLRGDLIKFFKPKPRATAMLYQPLQLKAMSAELASQIENASILGRVSGYSAGDLQVTVSATGNTLHVPLAGILNPDLDSKAELAEQPINSRGGVPSDGELMAITSLMPIAEQVNGVSSSYWNVLAHNGIILWDTYCLLTAGRNSCTGFGIGQCLGDVHSSVQSTMKAAYQKLQWVASIIAHSPMYITDDTTPDGYIWDVDYIGLITVNSLDTAITRVVRSLFQVNLPERE